MPSGGLLPKTPAMTLTMSIPDSADDLLLCLHTQTPTEAVLLSSSPGCTPHEIGSGFACCFSQFPALCTLSAMYRLACTAGSGLLVVR